MPNCTLISLPCAPSLAQPSASVQHSVHLRHVRLVVHNSPIYFDPCVRLKRHLLRPDDELRTYSLLFQQACRGRRPLQAQRLFPIPNAGHIHSGTDFFNGVESRCSLADRVIAYAGVERREGPPCQIEIEVNQFQICFQYEESHFELHPFKLAIATDHKEMPHGRSVPQYARSTEVPGNGRETCCNREGSGVRSCWRLVVARSSFGRGADCSSDRRRRKQSSWLDSGRLHGLGDTANI